MHVLRTGQMHRDARVCSRANASAVRWMEAARRRQVGQFLDKWSENSRLLIHRCIKSVYAGGSVRIKSASCIYGPVYFSYHLNKENRVKTRFDEIKIFHAMTDNSDNDASLAQHAALSLLTHANISLCIITVRIISFTRAFYLFVVLFLSI